VVVGVDAGQPVGLLLREKVNALVGFDVVFSQNRSPFALILMTLVTKYYAGSDLRFYFGGQLLSNFNDTFGLVNVTTTPSIDGASTVAFGLLGGVPTIAPPKTCQGRGGLYPIGISALAHSRSYSGRPRGWLDSFLVLRV
jgi:hypothetical protein